jgi:hypothetical protein
LEVPEFSIIGEQLDPSIQDNESIAVLSEFHVFGGEILVNLAEVGARHARPFENIHGFSRSLCAHVEVGDKKVVIDVGRG